VQISLAAAAAAAAATTTTSTKVHLKVTLTVAEHHKIYIKHEARLKLTVYCSRQEQWQLQLSAK